MNPDESPFEEPRMEDLPDGNGRIVRWFYIAWMISLGVLFVLGLVNAVVNG